MVGFEVTVHEAVRPALAILRSCKVAGQGTFRHGGKQQQTFKNVKLKRKAAIGPFLQKGPRADMVQLPNSHLPESRHTSEENGNAHTSPFKPEKRRSNPQIQTHQPTGKLARQVVVEQPISAASWRTQLW